jgi:acylphosphatase
VLVYGRVQGVFFRDFILKQASGLGIFGYVRNLNGGKALEVRAEGERTKLEEMIDDINTGPPAAKVEKTEVIWSDYSGKYSNFSIVY